MENIAHWAVIENHNLAEIRLDLRKILDVRPVAKRAVLSIISPRKVLALYLEPVDYWIGVFLHRSGEYD